MESPIVAVFTLLTALLDYSIDLGFLNVNGGVCGGLVCPKKKIDEVL